MPESPMPRPASDDGMLARAEKAEAEASKYRAHILDIAGHATPYGDLPREPGYVGTYLLSAGALHRALGTLGHTAPSCVAERRLANIVERCQASDWIVCAEVLRMAGAPKEASPDA